MIAFGKVKQLEKKLKEIEIRLEEAEKQIRDKVIPVPKEEED